LLSFIQEHWKIYFGCRVIAGSSRCHFGGKSQQLYIVTLTHTDTHAQAHTRTHAEHGYVKSLLFLEKAGS